MIPYLFAGCEFVAVIALFCLFDRKGVERGRKEAGEAREKAYRDGYSKGWSDCECWWVEQDAETQKVREEMWRAGL
jgi:hypothetical protein